MEILTLHFKESIREKLLKLLATFPESDLKISAPYNFEEIKTSVHEDYIDYKSGKSKILSIDEVEDEMNKIISENENRNNG